MNKNWELNGCMGEKEGKVKNDTRFLDGTSKTIVLFNEMGTKGGRKMIRSIFGILPFRYIYGEMSRGGW